MAKNNETLNSDLFSLLRSRGYQPTMLGTDGKEIPVPEEAEVFQFKFIKDEQDYGPVTISIDGMHKLVIYFGDNIANSPSEETHSEDTSWYSLLNHLKRFSQKHQLSFEVKNTDHLKYDMAKRNHMKKIDEAYDDNREYGGAGKGRSADATETANITRRAQAAAKKAEKTFKSNDELRQWFNKQKKVEEAAKWRQGYSASGQPAGHKHKSGEVGPVGGTFTNEPAGYDGETSKVPVQKHRDQPDQLADRGQTKLSTTGKPLTAKNAQRNLKGAIVQSKGKHGPVGVLPEGLGDDFADMARGMKNKDGSPRFANVRQGKPPVKPAGKATAPRAAEKGATSPADWYDQASGGRRYTGDSKVPTGTMVEGYYATGRKSSYSDNIPEVKIILQHSRALEEGERRYRAVEKIFVENQQGERFAVPTNKPGLARVYARHIAEGGTPYDDHGKHITSLCEEYTKMAGFVRATRNKQFNESAQSLVNEGANHYQSLRETLHKMQGHRGYHAYFESYTPTLTEDEDSTDLSEMFASSELDPRIESVMPILRKLNKTIAEMVETTDLGKWADELIEESMGEEEVVESLAAMGHAAERECAQQDQPRQAAPAARVAPAQSRPWTLTLNGKVIGTDKNVAVLRALQQKRGGKIVRQGEVAEDRDDREDDEGYARTKQADDAHNRASKIARLSTAARAIDRVERMKKALAADAKTKPADLKANLEKMLGAQEKKVEVDEVSTELLGRYKKKAGEQATVADKAGNFEKGHKRFKGIMKATHKQFANNKPKQVDEADGLESNNPEGIPEGIEPDKKQRLDALIVQYRNATDPESQDYNTDFGMDNLLNNDDDPEEIIAQIRAEFGNRTADSIEHGPSMHYPRDNHTHGYDPLADKKSPRVTQAGKVNKQDAGYMKRSIQGNLGNNKLAGVLPEEVEEDISPEQKRVGQLGPKDKVGKKGAVGKLVGANESVDPLDRFKFLLGLK